MSNYFTMYTYKVVGVTVLAFVTHSGYHCYSYYLSDNNLGVQMYCLWPLLHLLFMCTTLVLFVCTTLVLFMCTTCTLVLFMCTTLLLFMCSTLVLFVCTTLVLFVCTTLVLFVCTTLVLFMCTTLLLYTWESEGTWESQSCTNFFNFLAPFICNSFYKTVAVLAFWLSLLLFK